ncbi:serine/threonine-protein kinase [Streptacidiphilus sp. N1-10]|uniref:non-specific serine/threonine protein kinase n=1 Tax=Streptacidiphilus jeojiensis TaxID=3229225 RepID=A0ABV6XVL4_9ACTN
MTPAQRVVAERYRLDSLIGKGGMGQVWAGTDLRLGRRVAVKLLRDDLVSSTTGAAVTSSLDLADQQARFTRECRITARLDHPGLVTVFDAGSDGRHHFLVMQLLDGMTLADLIAENDDLPYSWAVSVAAQLCAALATVHAVPAVHRDLKPGNVMVRPDGRVVLLDLGIASAFEPELSTLTRTGHPVGTPSYMAPEQALSGRAEPRSDLYALGCTLYAMLTGDAPFQGRTPLAVMTQHVSQPPRPVRELRPDLPDALEQLVTRLLAKDPADRPASAQEVYRLLLPLLPRSSTDSAAALRAGVQPDPSRPFRHPAAPPPGPGAGPGAGSAPEGPAPAEAARLASGLYEARRYGEAAALLASAVPRAAAEHGSTAAPVRDLRRLHARVLMDDQQYRRAHEEYDLLARAYAAERGPDAVEALECAASAAECLAHSGNAVGALAECRAVLAGYERRRMQGLAVEPERVFRIRQRIGELLLAADDPEAAQAALLPLWHELERCYGPHHARVAEVGGLLGAARSAAEGRAARMPTGFGPPPPAW